jgi:hypothetical protein
LGLGPNPNDQGPLAYPIRYNQSKSEAFDMRTNYSRIRFMGSSILGAFFAWVATFAGRDASPKPQTVLIFIALTLIFARVLLWVFRRGDMATAHSAHPTIR